jgi:hypothetical protein
MSLYTLPVSVTDLTQLQQGIEFFTNTTEAATEAGLINAPTPSSTVFSYAAQLLANNISLSQVAMAVDSLMFGGVDSLDELAKLSTQFLPAQVAHAVASGFNPTVYAAEALGLALAGGNGTSNNFATDFSSLSVSQFASEVASLTGVNSAAIQGFAQNWENFYTANPSATFGLSVTLASYGAAFGDAVGAALLNPTADAGTALLVSEEQNALIDHAAGFEFVENIPLSTVPAHLPLQGEVIQIPDAGGGTLGPTINWDLVGGEIPSPLEPSPFLSLPDYAQFVAPSQVGPLTINNAPVIFSLDTQHYGTSSYSSANVISALNNAGSTFTLILGDNTSGESFGAVTVNGYPTVDIVVNGSDSLANSFVDNAPVSSSAQLVISGSSGSSLDLGTAAFDPGVDSVAVFGGRIFDYGVSLETGAVNAAVIDASGAPLLDMLAPADPGGREGVTVSGGTGPGNTLQGSLGTTVEAVTFSNGGVGFVFADVGSDNITSNSAGGGDFIFPDGGSDTVTLAPNHTGSDTVVFGEVLIGKDNVPFAITDGEDNAYQGFWGANGPSYVPVPNLFPGNNTGGTSADMTTITSFIAGAGGDVLQFRVADWNGGSSGPPPPPAGSSLNGDLIVLGGGSVATPVGDGAAQLSPVWVNSSNNPLTTSEDVLLYAPSGVTETNAQQLAAQLHTPSGAIVLGEFPVGPKQDLHILVAYDAKTFINKAGVLVPQFATNIADVDLVNTSTSAQDSTVNLNVYASDMVHLTGVSLSSVTPANIDFV